MGTMHFNNKTYILGKKLKLLRMQEKTQKLLGREMLKANPSAISSIEIQIETLTQEHELDCNADAWRRPYANACILKAPETTSHPRR